MWHEIKNIFHFIITFQCLLFAVFLLSQGRNKRQSSKILVAFLFSIVIIETGGIATHFTVLAELIYNSFPIFHYIVFPFHFLYVPLLFLYVVSFTNKDFRIRLIDNLHFIPFLVIYILFIVKYLSANPDLLRGYLKTGHLFQIAEEQLYNLLELIQFFFYAIVSLFILRNYVGNIKDRFSSIERISLSWLKFVLIGFIIWKSMLLFNSILWTNFQNTIPEFIFIILYISALVIFLIFLSIMFLKGLKQPVVFLVKIGNHANRKYEKTLLPDVKKEEYRNRLLQCMKTEKPYLDPMIGLQELAQKLSIPPHDLSQVLNTTLEQNFFDFINSYRIEESKKIFSEDPSNKKTILEILYESGFNSKSVFNIAFKKQTGLTPTQFRKLQHS